MHPRTERAFQLLGASRPDLAVAEFRAALADDPSEGRALAGLAIALSATDRDAEALGAAQAAVAAAPDLGLARGALAQCLLGSRRPKEALAEANAAIGLEPMHARHHGLAALASLQLALPQDALAAAERGLSIDADDELCGNVRGMALVRLNRRDHAESSLRSTLARDPESPLAHATLGHSLLAQGKVKEAAGHFREALRRDPTNEFARAGLMHTLRSRFGVYRVVLWWMGFCARMPRNVLVAVVVLSFLLPQLLASIAHSYPAAAALTTPIRLLLVGLVVLTWVGVPLFNGLLLISRDGRLLLTRSERWWGVASLALLASMIGFGALAVLGPTVRVRALLLALSSFLLLAPVGLASEWWDRPGRRWAGVGLVALMAGIAGWSVLAETISPIALATFGVVILSNIDGIAAARRQ